MAVVKGSFALKMLQSAGLARIVHTQVGRWPIRGEYDIARHGFKSEGVTWWRRVDLFPPKSANNPIFSVRRREGASPAKAAVFRVDFPAQLSLRASRKD